MSDTSIKELIFDGNDNSITVEYTLAGFDFSQTTKVQFELGGKTFNSTDSAAFFDIATGPLTVGSGTFVFKMGAAGFVRSDSGNATITLFDPSTPNGLIFSSPSGPTNVAVNIVV